MILNEQGKEEFLNNNFHPFFDIKLVTEASEENIEQFVNYVLPISVIDEQYSITTDMKIFFNDNYNNVVFTSADETNIYQYECYQNVYFIKMKPFQKQIRMHILPKKYDASDDILIFKDNKQTIGEDNFNCTSEYERKQDKTNINLYYKENTAKSSNGIYKFNIKDKTKNFRNLQINMGYSYNDTNPTNPLKIKHYTGVLDESDEDGVSISPNEFTEFNLSLMDVNCDHNLTQPSNSEYTNVSQQQELVNNTIQWPSNVIAYSDRETDHVLGLNNPHTTNTTYHKTIKYFNGDIYIEENNKYLIQLWTEKRNNNG